MDQTANTLTTSESSPTQHAMLIVWGHFARTIGLLERLAQVPIRQKTVVRALQEKLVEFQIGLLSGIEYLTDLSEGAAPLVNDKEAIVTGIYTIAPHLRTPAEVVATLFHRPSGAAQANDERDPPQNKQLWATLDGKDRALQRLAEQIAARVGAHIRHRVALTDGSEALQERVQRHCPAFTLVLDFIHANEKVWDVANSLFGEQAPERDPWVEQQTLRMLSGQTDQVLTEFHRLAESDQHTQPQCTVLTQVANYFERNRTYMHYDEYLAKGWPIASGVIEGACWHLVKDRCELSSMRWTQEGAEHLLRLRAVAENGDWADYHQFRKQQRHMRLYGLPLPQQ